MARMNLMDAAELARLSYKGSTRLPPVLTTIDEGHVEAYLLRDRTLVIPGSGELRDYTRSNLVASAAKLKWPGIGTAAAAALWHKGFARHAMVIANALDGVKPKFIVGHSLGAAAAQILGCIWGVPAIGFASPMPLRTQGWLANEHKILNVVRNDDFVCRVPPKSLGFRRVGNTQVMMPRGINIGEDHSMKQYIKLLKVELRDKTIMKHWSAR
ncbi:alpha/beta hydrolase family protein [Pseudooctadecabacter jejudonensis]|uniref:Fungal lipase-like domain-containing protein n=1 Tax=Pseudooctadecabacter jejudonensis TaxID=1391910 RepID=A0A1Y5T178_9RHOB|nr:hypothetical protein [Pseudooctadecabacter jejudonensis]SLN51770.1 hypothetical protein PSJ8397_02720 [Pseudooctadecabacter jejudonensis]